MFDLTLAQTASATVVRKPVTCSACGEPRTQIARCENCGNEKPFEDEKNVTKTESSVSAQKR